MEFKSGDMVLVWKNEKALNGKGENWMKHFDRLLTNKPMKIRHVYDQLKEAAVQFKIKDDSSLDIPFACIVPAYNKAKGTNKGWSAFKITWTKVKDSDNLKVKLWCNMSIQRKLKKLVLDEVTDYTAYTGDLKPIVRHLVPTFVRNNFRTEDIIVFSKDLVANRVLEFEVTGFDAIDTLKNRMLRVTQSLETIEGRSDEITIKVIEK